MEALEKLQAEVDALRNAGEVSKTAFDTFCEETKENSEESSKKQQDQETATDDLKQEVVLLSDKVKEIQGLGYMPKSQLKRQCVSRRII